MIDTAITRRCDAVTMLDRTERWVVYVLCAVTLLLSLIALSRSVELPDTRAIAISLVLAGIAVATAIAARSSGRPSLETGEDPLVETW